MRWVLITPFGVPVEPEVNRNFAIVSGPTMACAASSAAETGRFLRFENHLDVARHDRVDRPAEQPRGPRRTPVLASSARRCERSLPKSPDASEYAGATGV